MGTVKHCADSYMALNLICHRPVAMAIYDINNQPQQKIYEWFNLRFKGKIFAREIEGMAQRTLSFQDRIVEMTECNSIVIAVMKYLSANLHSVTTEYYGLKYDMENNVLYHEDGEGYMFRLDEWGKEHSEAKLLRDILDRACDIGVFQLEKRYETISQAEAFIDFTPPTRKYACENSNSAYHFFGITSTKYGEVTDPNVHETVKWDFHEVEDKSLEEIKKVYKRAGLTRDMRLRDNNPAQTKKSKYRK